MNHIIENLAARLQPLLNIDFSKVTLSNRFFGKKHSERRDYGLGVRLWNDRDPRADQSFFLGGVPGFVLSHDQRLIDWNIAFDMVFGNSPGMARGMPVSDWYKQIDNFRRIPNREAKLFGEAVLPITDRERVVFLSPEYGRIVFMKIMSPVLDRVSGRIIGWNVTLNINSVHERVKFFDDLYARIDAHSRHARYIAGAEQILARSSTHFEFTKAIVDKLSQAQKILVIGAVKSEAVIDRLLEEDEHCIVTVVDDDAEALRLVRARCGRFQQRIRLVRRSLKKLNKLPVGRFDAAVIMYPRWQAHELASGVASVFAALPANTTVLVAGYTSAESATHWWNVARNELEQLGELDLLKWHWQTVVQEDLSLVSASSYVPDSRSASPVWVANAGAKLSRVSRGYLGGGGSIAILSRAS